MTTARPAHSIASKLQANCARAGFDLTQAFPADTFNRTAAPDEALPDFGRSHAHAVVIGNTRSLWPTFLDALRADPDLAQATHPLDAYVERAVSGALHELGVETVVRFAHHLEPRPIPIQRIAAASGLAPIGPARLSVHMTYGMWFSLRAVVVLDEDFVGSEKPLATPCEGCAHPCLPALDRAERARTPEAWLDVRQACPVGREHRYCIEQLAYHLKKDRARLVALVGGRTR